MDYLNSERFLEKAKKTTDFLAKKLEKNRHIKNDLEVCFDFAVLQTKSQFYDWNKNSDDIVKHIFSIEDEFEAYSYIGPNTYQMYGKEILNTLETILQVSFLTDKPIKRIETKDAGLQSDIFWCLRFVVRAPDLPDNVLLVVALMTKGKLYWLQDELGDYSSEES